MTDSNISMKTLKKIAGVFVDSLAWTGLALGLLLLAAAFVPGLERGLESFVGAVLLNSN